MKTEPGFKEWRVVLIGSNGLLGGMIKKTAPRAWNLSAFDRHDLDISDPDSVERAFWEISPEVIINCAANSDVEFCESNEALAMKVNGNGPGILAAYAEKCGAILVHFSSDYVFDGKKEDPYLETDKQSPLSVYGKSKLAGDKAILNSGLKQFFIIRTSWLFGPGGKCFVEKILRQAMEKEEIRVVADQFGSPTFTGDLAKAVFALLDLSQKAGPTDRTKSIFGIYNFTNLGICSWFEFASEVVSMVSKRGRSIKARSVIPIRTHEYPLRASRPAYSVLSKDKYLAVTGKKIPTWRQSLRKYISK